MGFLRYSRSNFPALHVQNIPSCRAFGNTHQFIMGNLWINPSLQESNGHIFCIKGWWVEFNVKGVLCILSTDWPIEYSLFSQLIKITTYQAHWQRHAGICFLLEKETWLTKIKLIFIFVLILNKILMIKNGWPTITQMGASLWWTSEVCVSLPMRVKLL